MVQDKKRRTVAEVDKQFEQYRKETEESMAILMAELSELRDNLSGVSENHSSSKVVSEDEDVIPEKVQKAMNVVDFVNTVPVKGETPVDVIIREQSKVVLPQSQILLSESVSKDKRFKKPKRTTVCLYCGQIVDPDVQKAIASINTLEKEVTNENE